MDKSIVPLQGGSKQNDHGGIKGSSLMILLQFSQLLLRFFSPTEVLSERECFAELVV